VSEELQEVEVTQEVSEVLQEGEEAEDMTSSSKTILVEDLLKLVRYSLSVSAIN